MYHLIDPGQQLYRPCSVPVTLPTDLQDRIIKNILIPRSKNIQYLEREQGLKEVAFFLVVKESANTFHQTLFLKIEYKLELATVRKEGTPPTFSTKAILFKLFLFDPDPRIETGIGTIRFSKDADLQNLKDKLEVRTPTREEALAKCAVVQPAAARCIAQHSSLKVLETSFFGVVRGGLDRLRSLL